MRDAQKGTLIRMGFGDPSWALDLESAEDVKAISDDIQSFLEDELEELQLVLSALTQEAKASKTNSATLKVLKLNLNACCHRIEKSKAFVFFQKAALYTLKRLSRFSQEGRHHYEMISNNTNILKYGPALIYLKESIDFPWSTAGIQKELTYYHDENMHKIDSIFSEFIILAEEVEEDSREELDSHHPYIGISTFDKSSSKNLISEYFIGSSDAKDCLQLLFQQSFLSTVSVFLGEPDVENMTHRVSWISHQEVHGSQDISRIRKGEEATKGQRSDLKLIKEYTVNLIEKCFKDACEYHRLVTYNHAPFGIHFKECPDWDGLLKLIHLMNKSLLSVIFNNLKGIEYLDGPDLSTSSYEKMYSLLAKNKLEVSKVPTIKELGKYKGGFGLVREIATSGGLKKFRQDYENWLKKNSGHKSPEEE